MTIYARRVVFVIDISGSMEGPRLQAAKEELLGAIAGLPEQASFSIVAFSSHVWVWQSGLIPATPAAKETARAYVQGLRARGETAASDALDAAFRFDTEAVFFLTDGQPNAGKIRSPGGILAALTPANRGRRISVYTIGIAPGPPGGVFDTFLSRLAEENWGLYRRVER